MSEHTPDIPAPQQDLRQRLEWLRARYDGGAVAPAVYALIRQIEIDLAWAQHREVRS